MKLLNAPPPTDYYKAFEDVFRGSRALVLQRLQVYMPFVRGVRAQGGGRALDLGCGRGEWVETLLREGFEADGVDLDKDMLEEAHRFGLNVRHADAITALKAEPDSSLAIVSAFHLAEHLPFEALLSLITEARRALRPGGILILETPNPESLYVSTLSFHLDHTHIAPIPPIRMDFMVKYAGFDRHKILRLNGPAITQLHECGALPLSSVVSDVSPDYAIVAQVGEEGGKALDVAFERTLGADLHATISRFDQHFFDSLSMLQAEATSLREMIEAQSALLEQYTTIADWARKPFWIKLFFRRSGKPKKALRRALFHKSGKPRGIFRSLVLHPDGRPHSLFRQWMSSQEYRSLSGAVSAGSVSAGSALLSPDAERIAHQMAALRRSSSNKD